jgi:hypothetical protein
MIVVFKFPNFHLPFTMRHGGATVASAALLFLLIASYQGLWKRVGFWALLLVFLAGYWLVVVNLGEKLGGFQMGVLYGITGAVASAIFGLVMAQLYHQGPKVPSWIG